MPASPLSISITRTSWPIALSAGAGATVRSRLAGLADDCFSQDGQITKREVRAATLAALAPAPDQLLWDVGAGCGSVAIEWMRSTRGAMAIAIEPLEERRAFIAGLTEERLRADLSYRLLNGTTSSDPLHLLLRHVANHSTYHRGQVATFLRQLGVTPPSTDLIRYVREEKGQRQ